MSNHDKSTHSHLNAAKDEIRSAAEAAIDTAKDKVSDVVEDIATKVSDAADERHSKRL